MRIAPEWRGGSPPASVPQIVEARGSDIAPVDLADPLAALRLKSYVWPEAKERMARLDAAIGLAREAPPQIERASAAPWLERVLAEPPQPGVTRVVMHSIMWQYLSDEEQQRAASVIEKAGRRAENESPLAWVALEIDRATFAHELRVRYWPGGEREVQLANAHPHGQWVEWLAA